ncbi:MAG: hypothetical protein JWP25_4665 [Bradyrhizobium sp.]|nr:hypothetical protein [Bradyrhizobium sp.]
MRTREKRKPRTRRRRSACRSFLIDPEDFEFMDDLEMHDWMYGNPSGQIT